MDNSAISTPLLIPTSGIVNAMLATGISAAKVTADNLPVGVLPTGGSWALTSNLTITGARLGVGSTPQAVLDISNGTPNILDDLAYEGLLTGNSRALADGYGILTIQSNSAMAIDKGGSIMFGGRYATASSSSMNWGGLGGFKENGTSSNYAGYLAFSTRLDNHSISEKMRITSGGKVGIGAAAPTRLLDLVGTAVNDENGLSSQLCVRGPNDATQKLNIGYDTTSAFGYIESVHESTAWQNLCLQPRGGNVGIGTTAPGGVAEVCGSLGLRISEQTVDAASYYGKILYDSSGDGLFKLQASNVSTAYGHLLLQPDGGNVGIGTASPSQALEVYRSSGNCVTRVQSDSLGNSEQVQLIVSGKVSSTYYYGNIGVLKNGANSPSGYIALSNTSASVYYLWVDSSGKLLMSTDGANIGTTTGTVIGSQT